MSARFLGFAGPFLAAREAEHNLIFGVANTLRETPELYTGGAVPGGGRARTADRRGRPPDAALPADPVGGRRPGGARRAGRRRPRARPAGRRRRPVEVVDAFVAEWTARGGRPARIEMAEQIYQLSAVVPPRPVGGRWRIAEPGDRELVAAWSHAFMLEALHEDDEPGAAAMADRWLARHWPHPVPVGGRRRRVDGGRRWPDPERDPHRAGLHATGAARPRLRQRARRGRQPAPARCRPALLLPVTDAENPTSNHIYQAIGYEPVRDVRAYVFEPG